MSIKKKINFIFFYSFYRPGPRHIYPLMVGRGSGRGGGLKTRDKIPGPAHTCPFSILQLTEGGVGRAGLWGEARPGPKPKAHTTLTWL